MRDQLESLLVVVALGSAVAIAAKRASIPYNVALVVVGLLGVFTEVLPRTAMNPEVVLILFLPLLVFEAALFADADSLVAAKRPILALALPGVLVSLLGTAGVATLALGLPFVTSLLLGALLAITDTVSVLVAFRAVKVPHRLAAIMEGESLFNDGTALVLVTVCSAIVMTGEFSAGKLFGALTIAIVGGIAVGALAGVTASVVLRRTPDHLTSILASIVLVFAASLAAERVHASPVIAVVVCALFVGRAARRVLEPSRVLALQGFWETIGFCLNVLLFLLVGMQIRPQMLIAEAGSIAIAVVALHVGRAVSVYGCFGVLRALRKENVPIGWQHVMVLGNIKGALSMAAVLALPPELPNRDRLVAIVFGATFITLVTQGLPFRRILVMLGIDEGQGDRAIDDAKAALIAARRAQRELDELLATGLLSRREHAERKAAFQRRIIEAEGSLRSAAGVTAASTFTDRSILLAQKAAVLDAARRGLLSTEAAEHHAATLDHDLVDTSSHHEEGDS